MEIAVREPQQIAAADALHWLNAIENDADRIINDLPARTDDEVLEIRMAARSLGRASWRIECAADAEIMNRVSARQGRLKDEEGKGVHAAVLKAATAAGVDPRTVYQNASIYKTFFASESSFRNNDENGHLDILDEKAFYQAALATDDPHAALEQFAKARTEDPRFNTRDAWRMVKQAKAPDIDNDITSAIDNEQTRELWRDCKRRILTLGGRCPNLRGIIHPFIDEIEYELSRPTETIRQAIDHAIIEGYDEIDQIAQRINRNRDHVIAWMNRLEDEGEYLRFEKERAPGARGAARVGYRPKV